MIRYAFLQAIVLACGSYAYAESLPAQAACVAEPIIANDTERMLWAELGRDLFYDPILSGNKTVACATCHHPALGTSDGVALSIGDGGNRLGPKRQVNPSNMPEQRIPRNAPALFNLGYAEFSTLFHDGRVERLSGGLIRTPLGNVTDDRPLGVLAALSAFPVLSPDEMAGHYSENDVSDAVRRGVVKGEGGAYDILAERVLAIEDYRRRLDELNDREDEIVYADIARALAVFMAHEWRADSSPFDRFLCLGTPMSPEASEGMTLFYGKAGCSACHSGRFQTDHSFHAIAMPQIGPGKAERFETHRRDLGRMRVTGKQEDAYAFRTPSLRNVALTAPYGHAGAYPDLESVVRHHLDPVSALMNFDKAQVALPPLAGADDFAILQSVEDMRAIADANVIPPSSLTDKEVSALLAFLESLTDRSGVDGRLGVPDTVPSGLPVPGL